MKKEYLKAYFDYFKQPIDQDWIVGGMIVNMILLYIGSYFSNHKIINIVICTIVNLVMLYLLIYFNKKVKHDYKNMVLYCGVYFWELSVSCNYLAYQLLIKVLGRPVALFLIIILMLIVINLLTYIYINYKVKNGKYVGKTIRSNSIIIIGACFGTGLWSIIKYRMHDSFDYYCLYGLLLSLSGFTMATNISMFMKYHYYKIYETMESNCN